MNIIRNANSIRINCLGKQKIIENNNYRPLVYATSVKVNEGFLLYNNLTDELLFLTKQENEILNNFNVDDELCKYLIEKWYFVPEENLDYKLCDELDSFMNLLSETYEKDSYYNKYTILTTTECNARCFYCYEKNVKKFHMSEETADKAADFIINHSNNKPINIRWFGGEPLYNSKVIDIISDKLRDNNIVFSSSIVSNGYLFDDEIVSKAKKNWNVKRVQITLDGTEDKYNKIKAFIYPGVNAFERVILNIEKLLKADILVSIRMNMDNHNYENLFELVEFLCERFKGYKNLDIYSQTLFDESSEQHMNRSDDVRDNVFKNNRILNDYIKNKGYGTDITLDRYLKNNHCMEDNNKATTITPAGNLGKCEHFSDKYFWGSLYSDVIENKNIEMFKKRVPLVGKCYDCPGRPACLQLEACPDARRCNELLQKSHLNIIKTRIINTYNSYKKRV